MNDPKFNSYSKEVRKRICGKGLAESRDSISPHILVSYIKKYQEDYPELDFRSILRKTFFDVKKKNDLLMGDMKKINNLEYKDFKNYKNIKILVDELEKPKGLRDDFNLMYSMKEFIRYIKDKVDELELPYAFSDPVKELFIDEEFEDELEDTDLEDSIEIFDGIKYGLHESGFFLEWIYPDADPHFFNELSGISREQEQEYGVYRISEEERIAVDKAFEERMAEMDRQIEEKYGSKIVEEQKKQLRNKNEVRNTSNQMGKEILRTYNDKNIDRDAKQILSELRQLIDEDIFNKTTLDHLISKYKLKKSSSPSLGFILMDLEEINNYIEENKGSESMNKGKGKGWFGESERHSKARKTGKADMVNDTLDNKGDWITIKGKHIFIEKGQKLLFDKNGLYKKVSEKEYKQEKEKRIHKRMEKKGVERERAEQEIKEKREKRKKEAGYQNLTKKETIKKERKKIESKLHRLQELDKQRNWGIGELLILLLGIINGRKNINKINRSVNQFIKTINNNKKIKEKEKKQLIKEIKAIHSKLSKFSDEEKDMVEEEKGHANSLTEDVSRPRGRPHTIHNRGLKAGTIGALTSGAKRTNVYKGLQERGIGEISTEGLTVTSIGEAPELEDVETGEMRQGEIVPSNQPMTPLMSSNVKGAGVFNNQLLVQFHNSGWTYRYTFGSNEEANQAFQDISITSPGRYVWNKLRGKKMGPSIISNKLTPGGTSASIVPYDISSRTPMSKVGGHKEYEKRSKEMQEYKMGVKGMGEGATSGEPFTIEEIQAYHNQQMLGGINEEINRMNAYNEIQEELKRLKKGDMIDLYTINLIPVDLYEIQLSVHYDNVPISNFMKLENDFITNDFTILHGPIVRDGAYDYIDNKGGVQTLYKDWDNLKDVYSRYEYLPLRVSVKNGAHHAKEKDGFGYNFEINENTHTIDCDLVLIDDIENLTPILDPKEGYHVSPGYYDTIDNNVQIIKELDHIALSLGNEEMGRACTGENEQGISCTTVRKKNIHDQNLIKEVVN